MKIIDCFIFYNEIELLQARLFELYDIVDYFVLVEGSLTFTGNTKKLYYNDNKELFSKYNDKIIHIIVDDFPSTHDPWLREFHQRRSIQRGLDKLSLMDDDIIMITDVDEIPKSNVISSIKNNIIPINSNNMYSLVMSLYYYTFNWTTNRKWYKCKLLKYEKYNTIKDPETIRGSLNSYPIYDSGWHISYYGDVNYIINKLESFSEQQDNNSRNKNIDYLNECIQNGKLHFNNEQLIKNTLLNDIPKYFKILPKVAFTFWEGSQLSILNYLTVYTFSKFNPDYNIKIYYSNKKEHFKHIDTAIINDNNKIHASGFNFNDSKCITLSNLANIKNVEIINIDVEKEYNINFATSPIHKADIIRICKLFEHGGLWFDLDILFLKKVPDNINNTSKDILFFSYSNTIATGLIFSTPRNKAIEAIYKACIDKINFQTINNDWQQFGPTLWMNIYSTMNNLFNNCESLNNNEIYPYMWNEPELFFYTNMDKIKNNTWGVHWYNGNINSRKFIDTFEFNTDHIDKNKSIFYRCLYDIINN